MSETQAGIAYAMILSNPEKGATKTMRKLLLLIPLLLIMPGAAKAQTAPTFDYVVTTVDANGLESVFSNQASVTLLQGQSKVTLTWVAPTVPTGGAAIVGYNVYRGTVSGGPYAKVNTALVTGGTSYVDPFVPPNAASGLTAKAS